jgi:signal transduction histidine kinase
LRALASAIKKDHVVARCFPVLLLLLLLKAWDFQAAAQVATSASPAVSQEKISSQFNIGDSVEPLYGPWKFQMGDSPLDPVTHAPLWAEPGFDDSKWENVDLTPSKGVHGPVLGDPDYVSGWTARGHAGQWGYAWYRLRVQVNAASGVKLYLAGPQDMDDAYQVFVDGALLGSFGDFTSNRPVSYYIQPMIVPIPQPAEGSSGPTIKTIAFRVWVDPNTLLFSSDAGGFHTAPVLGERQAIAASYRLSRLELLRLYSPYAIEAVLFALLALLSFTLILFDRADHVYLWMGAVFLLTAAYSGVWALDVWTRHLSIMEATLISEDFLCPLAYAGWVMVWFFWFGCRRPAWTPRAAALLAILFIVSNTFGEELFYTVIPHPVAAAFAVASVAVRLLFFALLLWIVIQGIRSTGIEGWPVLPAIALLGIGMFKNQLDLLSIPATWFPLGVRVTAPQVANLLLVAVLALLLLRRLLLSVQRQRLIILDAKRAQLQSDFVSAVSHEFRSPLTTLRNITELLVEDRIPDEAQRRQSYRYLDRETTRLQRLVEDLLDFGRMESRRKQYRIGKYDAFQLVRAARADVDQQATANGFQVELNLAPLTPAIQVDEEAFRRAVRNLLENAMKYSPESRIVWVDGTVSNHRVSISVRDRGIGIDIADQDAIFQKFVRGSNAKMAGIKGTGLGLAMVKQIVEAFGGEVNLRSEVGAGSTFTLVLPLAKE